MRRLLIILLAAGLVMGVRQPPPQTLYQSMYVVSGKAPERRPVGFQEALRRLMVKVSGDRRLATDPVVEAMIAHAADYVVDFSYLDLKEGIKLSDEQGSYDRPHYLTVTFDKAKIDAALAELHRKVWADRPNLVVYLAVHRDPKPQFVPDTTDTRDDAMRISLGNASLLYSVPAAFPTPEAVAKYNPADPTTVTAAAGELPLIGTLNWSDKDLGWVADWTVTKDGKPVHWQIRGISFDDAFREGLSGAALFLSGNGTP
ncbi:MAG TPA: DUF2066 domain-containing protein [Vicinamibacterales bacterium]|nr:DUF2066 domain-containing protein [Vicinamibacterales bacterium]